MDLKRLQEHSLMMIMKPSVCETVALLGSCFLFSSDRIGAKLCETWGFVRDRRTLILQDILSVANFGVLWINFLFLAHRIQQDLPHRHVF